MLDLMLCMRNMWRRFCAMRGRGEEYVFIFYYNSWRKSQFNVDSLNHTKSALMHDLWKLYASYNFNIDSILLLSSFFTSNVFTYEISSMNWDFIFHYSVIITSAYQITTISIIQWYIFIWKFWYISLTRVRIQTNKFQKFYGICIICNFKYAQNRIIIICKSIPKSFRWLWPNKLSTLSIKGEVIYEKLNNSSNFSSCMTWIAILKRCMNSIWW